MPTTTSRTMPTSRQNPWGSPSADRISEPMRISRLKLTTSPATTETGRRWARHPVPFARDPRGFAGIDRSHQRRHAIACRRPRRRQVDFGRSGGLRWRGDAVARCHGSHGENDGQHRKDARRNAGDDSSHEANGDELYHPKSPLSRAATGPMPLSLRPGEALHVLASLRSRLGQRSCRRHRNRVARESPDARWAGLQDPAGAPSDHADRRSASPGSASRSRRPACPSRHHGGGGKVEPTGGHMCEVPLDLLVGGRSRLEQKLTNLLDSGPLEFVAGRTTHGEVGVGLDVDQSGLSQQPRQPSPEREIRPPFGQQGPECASSTCWPAAVPLLLVGAHQRLEGRVGLLHAAANHRAGGRRSWWTRASARSGTWTRTSRA